MDIIVDVFWRVKREGINHEASELERGKRLKKLFVMAFMVAIQIVRLRQAREGKREQKISLVFSEEQVECLEVSQQRKCEAYSGGGSLPPGSGPRGLHHLLNGGGAPVEGGL
jgi:hypothetical protein